MSLPELDSLLVENLSDIEASYKHLSIVEEAVFRSMGDLANNWAEDEGWACKWEYENDNFWLAPASWLAEAGDEKANYKAKFSLGLGEGDEGYGGADEDNFYLTRLCQAGVGMLGFSCFPEWKLLGVTAGTWKKRARAHAGELASVGFIINADGVIFRQVKIDAAALAKGLREQSIEDALGPFEEVLNQLRPSVAVVDGILAAV